MNHFHENLTFALASLFGNWQFTSFLHNIVKIEDLTFALASLAASASAAIAL